MKNSDSELDMSGVRKRKVQVPALGSEGTLAYRFLFDYLIYDYCDDMFPSSQA